MSLCRAHHQHSVTMLSPRHGTNTRVIAQNYVYKVHQQHYYVAAAVCTIWYRWFFINHI